MTDGSAAGDRAVTDGRRDRPDTRPWVVVRPSGDARWGGEIRRRHIFAELARRTDARSIDIWPKLRRYVVGRRWQLWRRLRERPFPYVVAAEQAGPSWIGKLPELGIPVAVAIYDDRAAQLEALGVAPEASRTAGLRIKLDLNRDLFHSLVVPTASFAELAGLPPEKLIVAGNGTIVDHIRPQPWPDRPSIGMVSGAARGRGIELLIEAARIVHADLPDLVLYLWLQPTGEEGEHYVHELRRGAPEPWIEIGAAPYATVGSALGRATALVIPHPAGTYMDVALPVKLFDSMAAGRPVVVTPRVETAAVIRRHGAGVVADGDTAENLAAALRTVLDDPATARQMGAAGRRAAEETYDWRVVGNRIADEVLRREGVTGR